MALLASTSLLNLFLLFFSCARGFNPVVTCVPAWPRTQLLYVTSMRCVFVCTRSSLACLCLRAHLIGTLWKRVSAASLSGYIAHFKLCCMSLPERDVLIFWVAGGFFSPDSLKLAFNELGFTGGLQDCSSSVDFLNCFLFLRFVLHAESMISRSGYW